MASAPPPICLHFDVNETIMLGDPAGGDSYDDSLNKILAKTAFVKPVTGCLPPYTWHDGSPLDPKQREAGATAPPLLDVFADVPEGCIRFYDVPELKKAHAKTFTGEESPGRIYAAVMDEMRAIMRWPTDVPRDDRLCTSDGYYVMLPSFFKVLAELRAARRPFSLVVRTFGSDTPHIIAAIDAFCEGKHPLHPGLLAPELKIPPERTWLGRYSSSDGSFTLIANPGGADPREDSAADASAVAAPTAPPLSEDAMLLELQGELSSLPRLSAVQDDYEWWRSHGYAPMSGKPLWLTLRDPSGWRHLFFDDNIHAKEDDSIVAVRMRRDVGQPFEAATGAATIELHGSVLRKVPTFKAVCDVDWFLKEIAACEENIDTLCKPMLAGGE